MIIGRIVWSASHVSSSTKIPGGEKIVTLDDVRIQERREPRTFHLVETIYKDLTRRFDPKHLFDPEMRSKVREEFEKLYKEERQKEEPDWKTLAGPSWFEKSIRLDENFTLTFSEHPDDNRYGFGLAASRGEKDSFSWEWFDVTAPGVAIKLQEQGELHVHTIQSPNGCEIGYTGFESDVSLRILGFSFIKPEMPKPVWRVKIEKGSCIFWPFLDGGTVAPSGTIATAIPNA